MNAAWFATRYSAAELSFRRVCSLSIGILIISLFGWTDALAQPTPSTMPMPMKLSTIYVQVSLPNGRPAGGALVTLTPSSGVPRKAFASDSGRLEFPGMPEGQYSLVATSPYDSNLVSDAVETNPSRTANGNLSVQLLLRNRSDYKKDPKLGVVRAGENEQKIPSQARKAFNEGLKFKGNDEPAKALESFKRAIALYPEYYQAFSERGDLNVSLRKLEEAEADFDQALKINAHYAPALRGSGYCKLEKKEFAEAVALFEQSSSADPNSASTNLLLGIGNLELGRFAVAKEALQKSLSFSPPAIRAHIYLANLYAKQHFYKEAADELHKYLEIEPNAPDRQSLEAIETQWRARVIAP